MDARSQQSISTSSGRVAEGTGSCDGDFDITVSCLQCFRVERLTPDQGEAETAPCCRVFGNAGDNSGTRVIQLELIAAFQDLLNLRGALPAPQLLFHTTAGRQLGHGFLSEITAFVQLDPIR